MNIFKFLNKTGKVALSAMQAVGITAVVGAAGLGAWQYLSGPADDNNAFNPAQYNPGEVVYVSGANTGGYASTTYGSGVPDSAVSVSAQNLKRLDRQEQAERAAREMEEESSQFYSSGDSGPGAYQMGSTEGLGMGANYVENANSDSSPMGAMQQSMAGMQAMINQAQQQVTGKATDGKQPAGNGANALGSASHNWSGGTGISAGGGNGGGSSFALQNSGKNRTRGGRNRGGTEVDAQNALNNLQTQASGMLEGQRIRGRSSFGSMDTLGANRDATVDKGRRGRNGNSDLEFIQKRSADAAGDRHRAANEGSRAFLASTQVSGGMRIAAENFVTGQGQSSKDFDTDTEVQLRGLRTWGGDVEAREAQHDADRQGLLWLTVGAAIATFALMLVIALTKDIPPYGWIAALAATVAIVGLIVALIVKIYKYQDTWGWEGMPIAATAVTVLLAAGAVAAWTFLGDALFSLGMKAAELLGMGFGPTAGTAVLGGTAAAGGAGSVIGTRK